MVVFFPCDKEEGAESKRAPVNQFPFPRESGGPESQAIRSGFWIPAFAGIQIAQPCTHSGMPIFAGTPVHGRV
jgi:hypothetical protein